MENSPVMVSVICLAYNHEEFISETLDGFAKQVTDFPVEFIIHDDCSKDGTRRIIDQYVSDYPGRFIPFYETSNQYSQNVNLFKLIAERARGKYIAICEGDDYWCDEHKLQIQVDYMEGHPECSLYMHNGYSYDNATGLRKPINPYDKTGYLTERELLIERILPPTASMMCKRQDLISEPEEIFGDTVGVLDRPLRMHLCMLGKAYYSDKIMCVYRTNTAVSFSSRSDNKKGAVRVLEGMLPVYRRYDAYTDNKYHREVKMMISREYFLCYLRSGEYFKCFCNRFFYRYIPLRQKLGIIKRAFLNGNT